MACVFARQAHVLFVFGQKEEAYEEKWFWKKNRSV